jgi:hypothetical protein
VAHPSAVVKIVNGHWVKQPAANALLTSAQNRKAWTAVVLVFLFMLINFADKAVIGLASVPIMRDLRLDHRQFGLLGSAFFLLFSGVTPPDSVIDAE